MSLFESDVLNLVSAKTLLLLDRGFYNFQFWQQLIEKKVDFITRIKKGASFEIKKVFSNSYGCNHSFPLPKKLEVKAK